MNTPPLKILIIDDEIDLCILLRHYFVQRQYEVRYAHSISAGMKMMTEWDPDILFLDNNLPDGTGWSYLSRFLSINPMLKIFLMSGYHPPIPENVKAEIRVIPKPISFADLQSIL